MFRWYWKILAGALVGLSYLCALNWAFKAVSSPSDLGVVLGIAGAISASFLATWLLARILKTRTTHAQVTSGVTGGDV
jgi:hypothetical protein